MNTARFVIIALVFGASSFADAPFRIGVFNSMRPGGKGKTYETVYERLKTVPEFKVNYFHALTVAEMEKFDTVVFACIISVGDQKEDWKGEIRSYVELGGSVLLTHDSCGATHALSPSLFPEVETALRRGPSSAIALTDAGKKITPEVKSPFESDWYDMVIMGPGVNGTVLAKNADGEAVAIAGNVDLGNVFAIGSLAGVAANAESAFLIACLRAAAKKAASGTSDPMVRELKKEVIFLKKRVEKLERDTRRIEKNAYNEIQFIKHGGKK